MFITNNTVYYFIANTVSDFRIIISLFYGNKPDHVSLTVNQTIALKHTWWGIEKYNERLWSHTDNVFKLMLEQKCVMNKNLTYNT